MYEAWIAGQGVCVVVTPLIEYPPRSWQGTCTKYIKAREGEQESKRARERGWGKRLSPHMQLAQEVKVSSLVWFGSLHVCVWCVHVWYSHHPLIHMAPRQRSPSQELICLTNHRLPELGALFILPLAVQSRNADPLTSPPTNLAVWQCFDGDS